MEPGAGDDASVAGAAPHAEGGVRVTFARLLGPASVYWTGHLVSAATGFLLLPVLTRYLSPDDYGALAMFALVTMVAEPLLGLNVAPAVSRRHFDLETGELARYVGTCLALVLVGSVVGLLLGLLLGTPLTRACLLPLGWVLTAILLAPLNSVFAVATSLLQVRHRPWGYTWLTGLRTLATAAGSLWLVIEAGMDWRGRASAMLATALVLLPVCLLVLRAGGLVRPAWDRAHARHALAFGVPLIPHVLGGVAMNLTDRLFLAHMVDLSSAGLYSVGYQVAFVIAMVQDGFNKAWVPWLFERLKGADERVKTRLVRMTYGYEAALIGGALAFSLLVPPLLSRIVPDRFDGAWQFVLWLSLAYAFEGAYKMRANYLFFAEKTHLLAAVTAGAAALNVPLTWGFIVLQGPVGAARATALVSLLTWLVTWALSARCFPMPWLRALRSDRRPA